MSFNKDAHTVRGNGSSPNILKQEFFAKAPNEKRATDITEFNVNGQKLYLPACMDLYNRRDHRAPYG